MGNHLINSLAFHGMYIFHHKGTRLDCVRWPRCKTCWIQKGFFCMKFPFPHQWQEVKGNILSLIYYERTPSWFRTFSVFVPTADHQSRMCVILETDFFAFRKARKMLVQQHISQQLVPFGDMYKVCNEFL